MSKFFEFTQNNSGGSFEVNDKLCHRLFIEAESEEDAVEKAQSMGVYFDGVEMDLDCPCCGDRWCEPWGETTFPLKFEEGVVFDTVEEYAQYLADKYGWTTPDARIYYKDGSVNEIFTNK